MATPELFSQELDSNTNNSSESNSNNNLKEEIKLFDNPTAEEVTGDAEKEPEMFKDADIDDDFEIPAFLRRQKN